MNELLVCAKQERFSARYYISQENITDVKDFEDTFLVMLEESNHSAVKLINLLVNTIPSFNDIAPPLPSTTKPLKFYKRAQILIADLWACFCNTSYGYFRD